MNGSMIQSALVRPVVQEPVFFLFNTLALALPGLVSDWGINTGFSLFAFCQGLATLAGSVWWSYLGTVLLCIYNRAWFKTLLYVPGMALMLVNLFLLWHFQTLLSPWVLMLIAETDSREASEFMSRYLLSGGTLLVAIFVLSFSMLVVFLEKKRRLLEKIGGKVERVFALALFTFLTVGFCLTAKSLQLLTLHTQFEVETWYNQKGLFTVSHAYGNLFFSTYHLSICSAETKRALDLSNQAFNTPAFCEENDSLDVVLIIGESYNKYHASLYGYSLITTPNMCKEQQNGRLFAFTRVVSPYNMTSLAMKNILSTNCLSEGEEWSDCPAFPVVFRKAGFSVLLWDNQKPQSAVGLMDFDMGSYMYSNRMVPIAYSQCNRQVFTFDHELIDSYFKEGCRGVHTLSLIHLMGQHFDAACRYPHTSANEVFHASDIARNDLSEWEREAVAQYDCATHYNDSLIGRLFHFFSNRNAVIVYLSDHGEEVYDYRHFIGRTHEQNKSVEAKKYQYDIPFVIWCSDKYKALHPEVVDAIAAAKDRPFSSDQTAHLLFTLSVVKTSYYKAECDVLQNNYTTK